MQLNASGWKTRADPEMSAGQPSQKNTYMLAYETELY